MKIVRIILAIIVLALSAYQLITWNFELMPYSMLFLGAIMLVTGLAELQKDRKGYMSIVVSSFLFFVSILGFLMNSLSLIDNAHEYSLIRRISNHMV
ncbi:DUF3953 domain-containing protein [Peribacillus butanolivorans]|uniref:DUF3953 domain-containing protein n=1 Tax=Peribacillus butanolivorans TaxID=421767 RepID=UPI003649AD7F